jgi:hypothetical protein
MGKMKPLAKAGTRPPSGAVRQPRRAALIAATSIFFIPIIASNARLSLFRYLLSKKDTLDLCFGSQHRHRRGATVVAPNGLSIW